MVNDDGAVYPILVDPLTLVVNLTGTQVSPKEEFGYVVADPGQIVGGNDSVGSLLVGAPQYDNGNATYAGAVFVFWGNPFPSSSWSYIGTQAGAYLGTSASTAGMLFGQTYDCIVVGAPCYSSGGYTWNGMAYVFAGGPNGPTGPVWSNPGWGNYMRYGQSVCGVENMLGTIYGGFAVGTPYYLQEGYAGYIDTWYGNGSSILGAGHGVFYGSASPQNPHFAQSLALGDVNNDGYPDLIVGAPLMSNGSSAPGAVVVYYGGYLSWNGRSATIVGESNGDDFGFSVAYVGKLMGYGDVCVGAPNHAPGGKAYLYPGTSSGISTTPSWSDYSVQSGAEWGYSVSGGMIGTGVGQNPPGGLIIGARNYTVLQGKCNGAAFVYTNTPPATPAYFWTIASPSPTDAGDELGWSVSYLAGIGYRAPGLVAAGPMSSKGGNVVGYYYSGP